VVEGLLRRKARLLRFLERRVGSRVDAEDLLQTALLRVVAKQRTLRRADRVVPWFYRILGNLVVDWHRRQAAASAARARIAADAATESWIEVERFREVCACVWDVLAALRPGYAEVIRRVDLDEQTPREVARALGLTPTNVSVRLHRARRALLEGLRLTCGACFEHGCLDCFCTRRRAPGRVERGRPTGPRLGRARRV
jgi:RNA polymerase sigma-70 factor (ECF subfamily)